MKKSLKFLLHDVLLRDVDITAKGFFYFLAGFFFYTLSIETVLFLIFLNLNILTIVLILITLLISIIFAGLIVDFSKNRMNLLVIVSIIILIGDIIAALQEAHFQVIGAMLIIFASTIYITNLQTVIIHESTILNRGRLTGYLFGFALIIASVVFTITAQNLWAIVGVELCYVLFNYLYIVKEYSYIETKERLASNLKLRELVFQKPIKGYLFSFTMLGFILGYSYPLSFNFFSSSVLYLALFVLFLILTGISLDNNGRKWCFSAGLFNAAVIIVFEGIFGSLFSDFLIGITIPFCIVVLFTFTGDFTTKRNAIRYRGQIFCVFLLLFIIAICCGGLVKGLFTEISQLHPSLAWFVEIKNRFNIFLLIVMILFMMPFPEILSAKEADWADTIKSIYIFNKNSICLYYKDFTDSSEIDHLPSEDLITSGLTGIMALISEITNEKKNLRIIDKENSKILFSYGKHVNIALISTRSLPILYKKMEIFMKTFEREFEYELTHFKGKINVFLENTDPIIERYFK
ncbi:MAG: hypothetical protein JW891_07135 [Candidatus Lokiarchaeota archaeon]|nr:hypothetical protein [Candidatus Lokiarchaeota archaeon]